MSVRLRALLGFASCLSPGGAAAYLTLSRPDLQGEPFATIFTGVISGSLVGAAIYGAETYRDSKADLEGEKQAFRLQVALTRDLSGVDVAGRDLTGLNLRGKVLRNANLEGCKLSNMDLSDVDFKGANLRHADLSGSLFTYADLRLVDARHSSFDGATLICADMRGGLFGGSSLRNVDAQGADCRTLSMGNYQRLSQKHGIRFRSRVSGVEWFSGTEGYVTRLEGIKTAGSAWTAARLDGADLDGADFSYCKLGDAYDTKREKPVWRVLLDAIIGRPIPVLTRRSGWMGPGIPKGPASFNGASVRGTIFDHCSGPGVSMDEIQLNASAVPVPMHARVGGEVQQ